MNSDIQSKLAHYILAPMTLVAGAIVNQASAAIDAVGAHALSLALAANRVIEVADVLTYKFQTSVDGSTNWIDLAVEQNLPYSADLKVVTTVVGETQNVGCFSNLNFVRIVFNGTVDTTNLVLTLPYVLEVNQTEADRYIVGGLPGDSLP